MVELIKLAKMAGVMHEADHAYSIRSTWCLNGLATIKFSGWTFNFFCF